MFPKHNYDTTTEPHESNVTLSSTLTVGDTEVCEKARGYVCTVGNGGSSPFKSHDSFQLSPW